MLPNSDPLDFSDIEGDLNEGSSGAPRREKAGSIAWTNPCPKCQGSGKFITFSGRVFGPCHMCKGSGKLTFKTSPEQRQRAKATTQARKERDRLQTLEAFKLAYPAQWAWICANPSFDFAVSMREAVTKYGNLTDGQHAAVDRCIARETERKAAQIAKTTTARAINTGRIEEVFQNAHNAQLKRPVLRVGELTLTLAPPGGKNPGAIYVTRAGDVYLGKVKDGVYSPSRDATAADLTLVEETGRDPLALAVAYGRRTGNCACCGRTLSDPESVERGIGPICLSKWSL